MKLSKHVLHAIDDADAHKFESALLHACIAIDATARRLYPSQRAVGARYVDCLRAYYWLIEPMIGAGLNLVETHFSNIKLQKTNAPDLAEIIYEIFRCHHAHGDEVSSNFSIVVTQGGFRSTWRLARGELHIPDRILWALLAVALFSRVNAGEKTTGDAYLSLGDERFPIAQWWGRETDFRPIADRHNQVRVKLDALDRLEKRP